MSKDKILNSKYSESFATLIGQLGLVTRQSRPDISFENQSQVV